MSHTKTNPADGDGGARKTDLHGKLICSEHSLDHHEVQARFLRDRYGLTWPIAHTVARLHYGDAA